MITRSFPRWRFGLTAIIFFTVAGLARADLIDYVKKPDPSFEWKFKGKTENDLGTIYDLHLVSQTWQGIKWQHQLQVYIPKGVKPTETWVLYNTGGKSNAVNIAIGMEMAKKANAPVAFLYGIPNQPLFGDEKKRGLSEDALIAETFVRYLKTGDADWPLLFPMAKSLVKAMDALQAFAMQEFRAVVRWFIITGGSKRGWTTWLTGAADPRVKAIAPMVIDTLNMQAQLPHQLKSYGKYSDMIHDYTARGLVPLPKTERAIKLWSMVDPWVYRARITMPTLIINGANDPYWTTDALNLYWDDLKCPRWVCYVPNAGHSLLENGIDPTRVANTLGAFARIQIHGHKMPKLTWKHDDADGKARLTVQCDPMPTKARLWVADAEKRDFRKSVWSQQAVKVNEKSVVGVVEIPKDAYRVFYGEIEYQIDGMTYYLSTQLRVLEKK